MPVIYTIGHSNRSREEFLFLLQQQKIEHLIDVRAIPRSRFVPWSNQIALSTLLNSEKIAYTHMPELGGRRKPKENSFNQGWKNEGYRGFADYMQTSEFFQALKRLNEFIAQSTCVIMCAEKLPENCHRLLISDAEIIRGNTIFHIISESLIQQHVLTDFAVVHQDKEPIEVLYPDNKNISLDFD